MNNFLFSCHGSSWIIVKGVGYTISISMCAHICILCIYTTGKVYFYMWNILMPSTYSISPKETLCTTRRTLTRALALHVSSCTCVCVCVCVYVFVVEERWFDRGAPAILFLDSRRRAGGILCERPLVRCTNGSIISSSGYEYNKEPKKYLFFFLLLLLSTFEPLCLLIVPFTFRKNNSF